MPIDEIIFGLENLNLNYEPIDEIQHLLKSVVCNGYMMFQFQTKSEGIADLAGYH